MEINLLIMDQGNNLAADQLFIVNYRKKRNLVYLCSAYRCKGYDFWQIITIFYLLITLICIFPGEIV